MSDAPTIKKKKLTLKTRKAEPQAEAEQAGTDKKGAAAAAARTRGNKVVDSAYHKPAAIIAILAALVFLATIAIQILEWSYYEQPPRVWPPKLVGPAAP